MPKARVPSDPATSGQALTPDTGTPTGRVTPPLCYCKQTIPDGARRIVLNVTVDWGANDLRDPMPVKTYTFHSFDCIREWATDRAAAHDDVVVREGTPAE